MDKKYQVFISSTYKDLKTARKHVSDTILSMGHFPVGMEMFGARTDEQWRIIQQTIDQSDYYIVIIGRCFGSEVPGEGISYTQKEFRYAKEKGLPILAFIAADDADIAASYQDTEPDKIAKLNKFKKELETGRTVDYWTNYDNLATAVAISLPKDFISHPMPGWIRSNDIPKLEMKNSSARERKSAQQRQKNKEIEQNLKDRLIDYSRIKTDTDRRSIAKYPWKKFIVNNLILRDNDSIKPTYGNGLIKVEPYDFYDEGILVFSPNSGAVVAVELMVGNKTKNISIDAYIVNAIPFTRITRFEEYGTGNYPYPTLYCSFENGSPFTEQWFIDKSTGIRYTEDQIVNTKIEETPDDNKIYIPTTDRTKISLYACILALYAAESDGRIIVLPSLSNTSYVAGGRNVERNQTPRELSRWDGAVSQLLGQGYTRLLGKKDMIYALTDNGYNLAQMFKEQCHVDPAKSPSEILDKFGVPKV